MIDTSNHSSTVTRTLTKLFFLYFSPSKAQIPLGRLLRNFPVTRATGKFRGKSATCLGEVAHMGHVTEKSEGSFKPSRHVEMDWKIPVTSRQQARLRCSKRQEVLSRSPRQDTGKSATSRTNQLERRRFVADRLVADRHGEVGIMEFGLNHAWPSNSVISWQRGIAVVMGHTNRHTRGGRGQQQRHLTLNAAVHWT